MIAFILRRLFQAVIVMISVALIAFMLFQFVGDPVLFRLGPSFVVINLSVDLLYFAAARACA